MGPWHILVSLNMYLLNKNMNFPGGGGGLVVKIRDPQRSLSLHRTYRLCVDMHEMNNCKINGFQKYRRLDYI